MRKSQVPVANYKIDEALLAVAEQGRAQALRPVGGGVRGVRTNPLSLEVNNGGLKTQTVDFQLLANSGGMENKL